MVETIDYLPTLLDAAGVPVPSPLQGRSLLPLIRGDREWRRESFGRDKLDRERFALRSGRPHPDPPPRTGRSELYDRRQDPASSVDLAGRNPETVAELVARLLEIVAHNRQTRGVAGHRPDHRDVLTDDEIAKLRAIGYLE